LHWRNCRHAPIEGLLLLPPNNHVTPPAHENLALAGGSVTVKLPAIIGVTTPLDETIRTCMT
jgi:hypothetical protein